MIILQNMSLSSHVASDSMDPRSTADPTPDDGSPATGSAASNSERSSIPGHRLHKKRQHQRRKTERRSVINSLVQALGYSPLSDEDLGLGEPEVIVGGAAGPSETPAAPVPLSSLFGSLPPVSAVVEDFAWDAFPPCIDCREGKLRFDRPGQQAATTTPTENQAGEDDNGDEQNSGAGAAARLNDYDAARTALTEKLVAGEKSRSKKKLRKLQRQLEEGDITEEQFHEKLRKTVRTVADDRRAGAEPCEDCQQCSLLSEDRGLRKRQQIENFVVLLETWLDARRRQRGSVSAQLGSSSAAGSSVSPPDHCSPRVDHHDEQDHHESLLPLVVDFGAGTGNLALPLAWHFRGRLRFLLLDRNPVSLEIASARAAEAGLSTVGRPDGHGAAISFDTFELSPTTLEKLPKFDLGIGLHACGGFTDLVLTACGLRKASCVVVPCCHGKIPAMAGSFMSSPLGNLPAMAGGLFRYPRSGVFSGKISSEDYLGVVCRAADDVGHDGVPSGAARDDPAFLSTTYGDEAKLLIELDRALWAMESESRPQIQLFTLRPPSCTPKNRGIFVTCF